MRRRTLIAIWSSGIIGWVVICSVGWWAATREDYVRLATASACLSAPPRAVAGAPCAALQASDVQRFKAEIDRKAVISRLAGAFGAMAALTALILSRRPSAG